MKYMDKSIVTVVGIAFLLLPHTFVFAQAPDTLWTKVYDRALDDRAYSIKQTPDSGYIIAASTAPDGAIHDIWFLKTDANGDTLWTLKYAKFSADTALDDWAYSVQRTFDGGYILAGLTYFWTRGDIYLIKIAPDTLGVGVKENHITNLPLLNLEVYPNPFSDRVDIRFSLEHSVESLELDIYDISGRLVKALAYPTPNALLPTLIRWNGRDDVGEKLPSGVYFLRFHVDKYAETAKLLLVRYYQTMGVTLLCHPHFAFYLFFLT